MNTMLSLGGAMPLLREVDGFMSFSTLNKADGILRTGIQTLVGNQRGVQNAVRQLAEVSFPSSFDPIRDNAWKHAGQKLLIEKVGQEYVIRFYDTDQGFEADSRVNP